MRSPQKEAPFELPRNEMASWRYLLGLPVPPKLNGAKSQFKRPMISQKAKYALRALVSLAKATPGKATATSDIAAAQKIPKKFLEQILLDLKRHGILTSLRGKDGGYLLLRRPGEVTFGEVLRLIDGPLAPLPCLSKVAYRRCRDCKNEGECEIRKVFAGVAAATREVLDNATLSSAVSEQDFLEAGKLEQHSPQTL
jgi:Rrf2 family protein